MLLKLILSVFLYFYVATRPFKIRHVAPIIFLLDSPALELAMNEYLCFLTGDFQIRPVQIIVQIHIFSPIKNFWSNLFCILDTG